MWQNHGYDHHQYTNIRYPFPADPPYVPKENYDKALAVQPDSCINMLKLMYLVIPFVLDAIITVILSRIKVEEANDKIRAEMKN